MDSNTLPEKFILAEETADEIWIYPILPDGSKSTEKMLLSKKGKQTESVAFVRTAWANANAYFRASMILKDASTHDSHLLLPISVQAAFACEIYLKCLLANININIKGDKHNLKNLHDHLTEDLKIKIKAGLPSEISADIFEKKLNSNADIFKKLRYVYEVTLVEFDMDFLLWFANELMQISKSELKI